MRQRRYLGVDAGGTSTRCALIDARGLVLARGAAGAANHHTTEPAAVRASVRASIRTALGAHDHDDATATPGDRGYVEAVGIGWSGLEVPGCEADARAIVGDSVDAKVMVLDSDVVAAHLGAFMGEPGVLVAAGTGSIVLGVDAAGKRVRVGGWGHRFGDEGSAAWIATEGIRAALHGADGRGPRTALWQALLEHAGLAAVPSTSFRATAHALTAWLYHPARHLNDVATFAPRLHAAAIAGDAVAAAVLHRAGVELARQVAAAVQRLEPQAYVAVAGTGGVWEHAAAVREGCRQALAESLPGVGVRWAPAAVDPAVGAAFMAMLADGHPLPGSD